MKSLLTSVLLLSGFFLKAQTSQAYEPVHVVSFQNPMTPLIILEHFARNNPDAIPFWGMEGKHYTVRYIDPETALGHKIVYNKYGSILRSENEKPLEECPVSLVAYYIKNYPNEKLRIWSYEENNGGKKYYFKRHSKILWFDAQGNYMRKKILWN